MATQISWDEAAARAIVEDLSHLEGAMLPILHALQGAFGYVDPRAIELIAERLNISRAEAHGTASFYHDFKREPSSGKRIKLCRAEACQARGCENLVDHLERKCGVKVDGDHHARVVVETVYCLGNCALGPNALVDGELIGRLDESRLDAICDSAGAHS